MTDTQAKPDPKSTGKGFNWRWVVRAMGRVIIGAVVLLPLFLAVLIVFLSPALGEKGIYKPLLFRPWKYPQGDYENAAIQGLQPIDVYFKNASGNLLHGWLYKLPQAKHVVLLSHGNGANMTGRRAVAFKFLQNHQSVFMYDYRGYGKSEGEPTIEGLIQDAHAAYDCLRDQLHYKAPQIILFGESLGTAVTGQLSPDVESAGIILECPLYSLRRKGQELLPFSTIYPIWAWPAQGMDSSQSFTRKHAPLLIISGTADPTTPVAHADDLFAVSSQPKMYVRINGAGHGNPLMMRAPQYDAGLRAFFASLP